jgi:anti-anti-sigma factor
MRDEKRNGAMLRIETQKLGNISTFRCTEGIIGRDGQTLWNTVSQSCARAVVLDLANVRAIDAAGLGTLVSLRMWAHASGTTLKLMNLTPFVEQILELTQLRGMFEVCSVPEMLDLLCRAAAQTPQPSAAMIRMPPDSCPTPLNFRAFKPVKAPDSVLQNS